MTSMPSVPSLKKPTKSKRHSFRLATINALGANHTDNKGGNKFGRWLKSSARSVILFTIITANRLNVIGFQEFQKPQKRRFKLAFKKVYGLHAIKDNSVAWKKRKWTLVERGGLAIPYFHGKMKKMPYVILEHKKSKKRIAVLSKHNPANVRGVAGEYRRKGWLIEGDWANEMLNTKIVSAVFVVGDSNAKAQYYLPVVKDHGGKEAGIDKAWGIDWIIGFGSFEFSKFRSFRTKRIKKAMDHPLVKTVVTF